MKIDPVKMSAKRRALGYSQDKLACMARVSLRTVQRAERGEALRGETIAELAAALQLTTPALLLVPAENPLPQGTGENMITLHAASTGREVIELLEGCVLSRIDCDVDPTPESIALLREAILFLERIMPDPNDEEKLGWPIRKSLVERLEVIAEGTSIIERLAEASFSLLIGRRFEMALMPRYGDEGLYLGRNQRHERVAAARLLINAAGSSKLVVNAEVRWPVDVIYSIFGDDDVDDDVQF